ncbi:hypothetical protein [Edaphobacter flagellatus]|uniref:hypothetical protein n=1 Tax=Edaphobacter flagellatus TaxID=1933044 RepID=UPI0021B20B2F|nr:hypothetical protein [Edaphobacter flagellatus]
MKRISISTMLLAAFVTSVPGFGQATPTAQAGITATPAAAAGPRISWLDGTVHYGLSATELLQFGYYGANNVTSTTALSGNVGYANLSQTHPFMMLYSGGVLIGQGGQGTTTFQNIALSQSLVKGRWILGVNDSFSYLPQSPTAGVSGIAGVGQIGTVPIQGPSYGPTGGVLTYSGNRIGNTVGGDIERLLTGRTSISGQGSWSVLHFIDDNAGLDTTTTTGQVALNHRFDLRNSASLSGVYSTYNTTGLFQNLPGFPRNNVTYQTKGLNATYQRMWTRSLSTNISAGPQWISSSAAQLVPNRLNAYVDAGLNYNRELTNYGIHYNHGVNAGSGTFAGAEADSISASVNHTFNRYWAASAWVNYTRTTGLLVTAPGGVATNGAVNTEYGTIQVTHGFTRTISGYVSYSAQNQDVNSSLASQNIFSGLSHTVGFGVSWTPRSTRLGDF